MFHQHKIFQRIKVGTLSFIELCMSSTLTIKKSCWINIALNKLGSCSGFEYDVYATVSSYFCSRVHLFWHSFFLSVCSFSCWLIWTLLFRVDTCRIPLMSEAAVSRGQVDASVKYFDWIHFLLKNKSYLEVHLSVYAQILYINVCVGNTLVSSMLFFRVGCMVPVFLISGWFDQVTFYLIPVYCSSYCSKDDTELYLLGKWCIVH